MPDAPWIMTQTWHDLLFAHWPIDPRVLRASVPLPLALDIFDGRAWVGVVPFEMTNVAPRIVPPLPRLSSFPELNVRTYVTVGGRPGVYFFSLDATSPIAVWSAKRIFRLPYFRAAIDVAPGDDVGDGVAYRSRRARRSDVVFDARYGAAGPAFQPEAGSLEYFLTERYCLYTVGAGGAVARTDIHHAPWSLQRAEAEIRANTMAAAAGITLPRDRPHLLFAKRQDAIAWLPCRVTMPPTEAP